MFQAGDLLLGKQPNEVKQIKHDSNGDIAVQKVLAGKVWEVIGPGRYDTVQVKNYATGERPSLAKLGYFEYRFTKI